MVHPTYPRPSPRFTRARPGEEPRGRAAAASIATVSPPANDHPRARGAPRLTPPLVRCRPIRSRSVVIVCSGHWLLLALIKLVGQKRERAVHDLGGDGVLRREEARFVRGLLLELGLGLGLRLGF